jgi:hypothetical protein
MASLLLKTNWLYALFKTSQLGLNYRFSFMWLPGGACSYFSSIQFSEANIIASDLIFRQIS